MQPMEGNIGLKIVDLPHSVPNFRNVPIECFIFFYNIRNLSKEEPFGLAFSQ